jgi:hypothetical protein
LGIIQLIFGLRLNPKKIVTDSRYRLCDGPTIFAPNILYYNFH